jgi:hypothetical protein
MGTYMYMRIRRTILLLTFVIDIRTVAIKFNNGSIVNVAKVSRLFAPNIRPLRTQMVMWVLTGGRR